MARWRGAVPNVWLKLSRAKTVGTGRNGTGRHGPRLAVTQ